MPAKEPLAWVVAYRGTPEFRAALERLQAAAGAADLCELLDKALAPLAAQHGVVLPARVRPWRNGASARKGVGE